MTHIIRRERFNAAHRLFRKDWSDEKNLKVFGKCSNPNWHGHNYELYVTVAGEIDQETGFVINLKDLSKIIKNKVIDKMDHSNLNLDVDFMKGRITSAENIAEAIWGELEEDIKAIGGTLYCVRLLETENNIVDYTTFLP